MIVLGKKGAFLFLGFPGTHSYVQTSSEVSVIRDGCGLGGLTLCHDVVVNSCLHHWAGGSCGTDSLRLDRFCGAGLLLYPEPLFPGQMMAPSLKRTFSLVAPGVGEPTTQSWPLITGHLPSCLCTPAACSAPDLACSFPRG